MDKKEHAGKMFSFEDAEYIKKRTQGMNDLHEMLNRVPLDSDKWAAVVTHEGRGLVSTEFHIPEVIFTMFHTIATYLSKIENKQVFLASLDAAMHGHQALMSSIAELYMRHFPEAVEANIQDFIEKVIKEAKERVNEDRNRNISDNGSS